MDEKQRKLTCFGTLAGVLAPSPGTGEERVKNIVDDKEAIKKSLLKYAELKDECMIMTVLTVKGPNGKEMEIPIADVVIAIGTQKGNEDETNDNYKAWVVSVSFPFESVTKLS
jgi:hypothetical protein